MDKHQERTVNNNNRNNGCHGAVLKPLVLALAAGLTPSAAMAPAHVEP